MKILTRASDELMKKLLECDYIEGIAEKYYVNTKGELCSAHLSPFLEQIKDCFLEEHNLMIRVYPKHDDNCFGYWIDCHPKRPQFSFVCVATDNNEFDSYDEALEAGLLTVCTICKFKFKGKDES